MVEEEGGEEICQSCGSPLRACMCPKHTDDEITASADQVVKISTPGEQRFKDDLAAWNRLPPKAKAGYGGSGPDAARRFLHSRMVRRKGK